MENNNRRLINKFVHDENLFMWVFGGMPHSCFISNDTFERYGKREGVMNTEEYFSNDELLEMKQAAEKELKRLINPEMDINIDMANKISILYEIHEIYLLEMAEYNRECHSDKKKLLLYFKAFNHVGNIETINEAQTMLKELFSKRILEVINELEIKANCPAPNYETYEQALERKIKEAKQSIDEIDFCLLLDKNFCEKLIYPEDDVFDRDNELYGRKWWE